MADPIEMIKALELARYLPPQPTATALERLSLSWEDYERYMQVTVEREQSLFAAYRRLSPDQGREVALFALNLFDANIYKDRYLPHELLTQVANIVPDALQGLYSELLKREIFWKSVYREADPATRNHLFRLVDEKAQESVTLSHLLEALAWIGDEVVQSQFHQWRKRLPAWRSSLYLSPHEYARVAGWACPAFVEPENSETKPVIAQRRRGSDTQRRMPSLPVVKHLQILKDGLPRLAVACPVLPISTFPFQGGKEAFH